MRVPSLPIADAGRSPNVQPAQATLWRTALIIMLLCFWEGFPFGILGLDAIVTYQIYAVMVLAGAGLYVITRFRFNRAVDRWEWGASALFLWCCAVSVNYSVFLTPQPAMQWLPSVYTITPVLTILLLRAVGANLADARRAIFWTGLAGSIMIVAESVAKTGMLDFYARGSAFSTSRIVFFKLPSAFALMIGLAQLVQARSIGAAILNAVAVILTGYNVAVLTESRLLIVAIALAMILFWAFAVHGIRKLFLSIAGPIILTPLLLFLSSRYLADYRGLDQYLTNDTSANWRKITSQHFAEYFERETHGMGFGFMSANPNYNNVLSFSSNQASKLYGVDNYTVALDDVGLSSALYQYGYIGICLVVAMTIACISTLVRSRRLGQEYSSTSALGLLMGTSMISPISMNYFTLFYTAHIGGLLWFMAADCSRLARQRAVRTTRMQADLKDKP